MKKCVSSVLESTYQNIEVICIDDGSTDDSFRILEALSGIDHRIVLIKNNKKGVSSARNLGIANAKGKYICFVDSDDWIDTRMISILVRVAKQRKTPIVACRSNQLTEDNANSVILQEGGNQEQTLKTNDILYNQ